MNSIKKQQRVTFCDVMIFEGVSSYTSEESKICWFTKADFTRFASDAQKEANQFQLQQHQSKSNPRSFSNVLTHVLECCSSGKVPSTKNFQYFLMWHRICPTIRGIERRCAPFVSSSASANNNTTNNNNVFHEHTEDSIASVMELQTKLQVKNVPFAQKCELIQKQYADKTQMSRLFARIQGIADASEAAKERKQPTSNKCPSTTNSPSSADVEEPPLSLPFKKRKCAYSSSSSNGIMEVYSKPKRMKRAAYSSDGIIKFHPQ